jgi:uncharacterized protein (UPF0332 family)
VHDDLIEQARRLARLDPRRPSQANLRRSISAAYYAMFHFLADAACRGVMGTGHSQRPYRHVLARAFSHSAMNGACRSFAGGTLPNRIAEALPNGFVVPVAIRRIAREFLDLQAARHLADYDLTASFLREDVLIAVQRAEGAIREFRNLPATDVKKFFLACLWAWAVLGNR